MMKAVRILVAFLSLLTAAIPALAVNPDELLKDPALEARARDISAGIRCLVCQNESIDASNADLARDLRILIRERLTAGDTDDEVRAFLVSRYGEFVLLQPTFSARNMILWLLPVLLLIAAGGALAVRARRRTSTTAKLELTASEQERIKQLLDDQ